MAESSFLIDRNKSRSKHGLSSMSPGLGGVKGRLAGGFLAGVLGNSQNRSGEGATTLVFSAFPLNNRGGVLDASHVIAAPETQQQEGKWFSFFNNLFCERSDVAGGRNFRLGLGFVQLTV